MNDSFRVVYLLGLAVLLGWLAWQIFRQVRRNVGVEGVINKLQPKLKSGQGTAEDFYELGCAYLEKRLYIDAIDDFKKAINLNPEFAEAYNNLGFCYFQQSQYDLAIRQYKEAVRFKANYASALNNLGHAYEMKGQAAQALEAYDQVLAVQPTNATAERRARALRKRVPSAAADG
ncbi:tetratricopeptide repeat protein [Gloeobacter kilaueensis]|uniref:Lipoprotein NlpI n=1 Tax=Gloeobacter kilaueensis (strain ATCC BAA-2537 / CCAP 1431/1 / ULC 316 / JS1) TaxID=1183438 RepID=U5QIV7_GLOK1|nr:tetratricopeptide repeat protein [Gloeobacter kilaueensis]AGY58907.1 lipoprotein NlpI [Gloeobacter kilaueensis JS1]